MKNALIAHFITHFFQYTATSVLSQGQSFRHRLTRPLSYAFRLPHSANGKAPLLQSEAAALYWFTNGIKKGKREIKESVKTISCGTVLSPADVISITLIFVECVNIL